MDFVLSIADIRHPKSDCGVKDVPYIKTLTHVLAIFILKKSVLDPQKLEVRVLTDASITNQTLISYCLALNFNPFPT